MARESGSVASLPEPPEIDRRVRIPAFRALGLAVMVAIPVLALIGLFGERWNREAAESGDIAVRVEYPSRYRYKMLNSITAAVTNRSNELIDTVMVRLDTSYALRFSTVVFTPAAEDAYAVPVTRIAPDETRLVVIELQGERYGRHEGGLHFESTSGDTLAIPVHTLIFP
jgi:hypothetical protein